MRRPHPAAARRGLGLLLALVLLGCSSHRDPERELQRRLQDLSEGSFSLAAVGDFQAKVSEWELLRPYASASALCAERPSACAGPSPGVPEGEFWWLPRDAQGRLLGLQRVSRGVASWEGPTPPPTRLPASARLSLSRPASGLPQLSQP